MVRCASVLVAMAKVVASIALLAFNAASIAASNEQGLAALGVRVKDDLEAQFRATSSQIEVFRSHRAQSGEKGFECTVSWDGYLPSWQRLSAETLRSASLIPSEDRDPADTVLRRTKALLADLRKTHDVVLSDEEAALNALGNRVAATAPQDASRYALYEELCRLRRKIAFANPLSAMDKILFIKRHPAGSNHMAQQFNGRDIRDGGGLCVLEDPFGREPRVRDLLADSLCQNGKFAGKKLIGGHFLAPDLSYDGRTVLFAWNCADLGENYAIFRVNSDGADLRQLTDGQANDFDPCWLPNGKIVFVSTRRGGVGRCFEWRQPAWTLHRMDADGGNITCLSYHETNEWGPCVDHDGMVVYTRWDYVDRGFNQAHHPWITSPDGRDPRALHGNYGRTPRARPFMEMDLQPIPGSRKFIATATGHHYQAFGSLVLLDFSLSDDGAMSQVRRLTPDSLFPEAETKESDGPQPYGTAWPLSEDYYLAAYAPLGGAEPHGLYLVDSFGNRELLYRDREIGCLNPMPIRARPMPPIVPDAIPIEEPASEKTATVGLVNVYDSLKPWPAGTKIRSLRIIQVLPKPDSAYARNRPKIGYPSENGARKVLGSVPVEADGSAHFVLPAGKPVYFQALDERGLAVQSMRSDTYAQPGQYLMCQGCHEPRTKSPTPPRQVPLALQRTASTIQAEIEGASPLNYPRLVQGVLDRHCVACHDKQPKSPDLSGRPGKLHGDWGWTASYENLDNYAFYYTSGGHSDWNRWVASETAPGHFGAKASRLFDILEKGHYDVKLPPEDLHRLTLWLDCNSDFYGGYDAPQAQARGEVVKPSLE